MNETTQSQTSSPVAVVTGASRGLGREIALELLARDWVVIGAARNADCLAAVGQPTGSGRFVAVAGDLTLPEARERVAAAVAQHARLDLLVNNAGTLGPSPLPAVLDLATADLRAVLDTNVVAPLALTQLLWRWLPADGGCVVTVTSDAAREPYAGWGGYGASKAALELLTAVLAVERPEVRACTFDPGDMRTDMHQLAYPGEDISDRPHPRRAALALLALVDSRRPSGRYTVEDVPVPAGVPA